ncbi:MAG: hypothetical protein AAB925_00945, partial [Patescibacteria group bacterium]
MKIVNCKLKIPVPKGSGSYPQPSLALAGFFCVKINECFPKRKKEERSFLLSRRPVFCVCRF